MWSQRDKDRQQLGYAVCDGADKDGISFGGSDIGLTSAHRWNAALRQGVLEEI